LGLAVRLDAGEAIDSDSTIAGNKALSFRTSVWVFRFEVHVISFGVPEAVILPSTFASIRFGITVDALLL